MKRILLILAFIASFAFMSQAQTYYYKAYQFTYKLSTWSSYTNWTSVSINIKIDIDNSYLKIYSKSEQIYRLYSANDGYDNDGDYIMKCSALDQDNLRCAIRLIYRKGGESQIYIDYNDCSWVYDVVKQ